MSAVFEGLLVPRAAEGTSGSGFKKQCESLMGEIQRGYTALDDSVTAVVRVGDRDAPFSEEFDELAAALSSVLGKALVVRYDSRIGHRSSAYFESGSMVGSFGEEDEIFSPLGDDGLVTGTRVRFHDLIEDEEYETVENAIQFGLRRFGAGIWDDLLFLIYNQEEMINL